MSATDTVENVVFLLHLLTVRKIQNNLLLKRRKLTFTKGHIYIRGKDFAFNISFNPVITIENCYIQIIIKDQVIL